MRRDMGNVSSAGGNKREGDGNSKADPDSNANSETDADPAAGA